jgi:hypothetical protein
MDWTQVYTIVGANIAFMLVSIGITFTLFLWVRAESRSDFRCMLNLLDAIQKEMKDFHGRLCALEEKNKGK